MFQIETPILDSDAMYKQVYILYNGIVQSQIETIGRHLERLVKQSEHPRLPQDVLVGEDGSFTTSVVVHAALNTFLANIRAITDWQYLLDGYLKIRSVAGVKRVPSGRHEDDMLIHLKASAVESAQSIAVYIEQHECPLTRHLYVGKWINWKLIVCVAMIYTNDLIRPLE